MRISDWSSDVCSSDLPRRAFQGIKDIEPGMSFQAQGPQGPMRVTVTRVAGDMVTVDGNHPLAGENLNFDVEITDVRAATAEAMEPGHVHGAGGHHPRSEERSLGKECVGTVKSRWSPHT